MKKWEMREIGNMGWLAPVRSSVWDTVVVCVASGAVALLFAYAVLASMK